MTEQWLLQDIDTRMQHRNRVVLLDPTGECGFALPIIKKRGYAVLEVDGELKESWKQVREELFLRHEAETVYQGKPVVFYVNRPQEKLSFLYDYCFTHGLVDMTYLQDWLKQKVFTHTGLQVNLDNPMLLTAAKLGIGKDLAWWKKIAQQIEDVIDLQEELLPFVHEPEKYVKNMEPDIKRLFEERVHELLGQQFVSKPAKTLAGEVVKRMLDGLLHNEIDEPLLQLYYRWVDSNKYQPSLKDYVNSYGVPENTNPWSAHPDHCFEKVDRIALKQLTANCRDKNFISEKLQRLKPRIKSSHATEFKPTWLKDVSTLFEGNTSTLNTCKNLGDIVLYYTNHFSKVDRAIRNLYQEFLGEETIIRPLQEHYESMNHLLLDAWFDHRSEYATDQQGYLPELLSNAGPRTAVIVGDGVRYEIADFVATQLGKEFQVQKNIMFADMPSETEHNMSALYVGGNAVLPVHKERELSLALTTGKQIVYKQLESISQVEKADYLVLTYKDIDSAGEKLQQAAIKLFSEFETVLVDKIKSLLNMGYKDVYLVTDHGFVLTGLLDEADKIDSTSKGDKETHERFVRTVEKQSKEEWIEFDVPYEKYKYVYAAKSHRPFKSKGVYGFSHGGFTPQEIILPKFRFSKKNPSTSALIVKIANKADLNDVPSELFMVKFEAATSSTDLFDGQRKVQLKLFAGGKEIQCSNVLAVKSGESSSLEFSFSGNTELQVVLTDAETKEQLDSGTVKKSNLRDLGGLL
jgi:hypothetical protein